jgi:dihydrodipicolinate synthase/N-acetylneuraminate lyase
MKAWMEMIGMAGGRVRPPVLPLAEVEHQDLCADLRRTGLLDKVQDVNKKPSAASGRSVA